MFEAAVTFDQVNKYYDDFHALQDISVSIEDGEVVVIIGPSGSGKSTLLRCTNRLEQIESGDIRLYGDSIHSSSVDVNRLRQRTGMVFQDFNLFNHMTALQNVTLAPKKVRGMSDSKAEPLAKDLLEKVDVEDELHSRPSELSGGQKQRVAIARALAMEPSIMLFDEVTSALDPELVGEVLGVIEDLAKEGMTMLIVTHQMNFAKSVADRLLFMDKGKIIEDTEAETFFEEPETRRAREFLSKIV